MVGLNPAIRDLCNNPKLLSSPTDPPDLLVPKFNDFSSTLNEHFPDFDSIEDWILEPDYVSAPIEGNGAENPQVMSSEETHQEIVVENLSPDGHDSVRAEFGFPEGTHPCLDGCDSKPAEIGFSGETHLEVGLKDRCPTGSDLERAEFQFSNETCQDANVEELHADGSDLTSPGFGVPGKSALSSISIEEEMGKVSLVGACNDISVNSDVARGEERDGSVRIDKCNGDAKSKENINVDGRVTEKGVTDENSVEIGEIVSQRDGKVSSASESTESEDSPSSSSGEEMDSDDSDDSDDDDDVEKKEEKEGQADEVAEVEEGEIRDFDREEIVVSSEDEEGGVVKGPVKSKNEIEILPPVPPVDVVLQPHHQMLPVGVVLTMMGAKVIVEGLEKHNPLNEGSILWITATRLPLGLVDEIFGPVKNPYYVVRFNSEKEVPSGICEGTAISFVAEFADHVLNDKSLYQKGYDASGDNDEEISDEAEFSDDEKEAEYRRSLRVAKKGKDRRENRESDGQKRAQFKGRFHKNVQPSSSPAPVAVGPPAPMGMGVPFVPAQLQGPQIPGPFGCGSCGCSFGSSGPICVPQISHVAQTTGLGALPQHLFMQSNAIWTNGMPAQQQHMGMLSGFQMNGVPHPQPTDHQHHQHQHQHQHQQQQQMFTGGSNGMPFQQQFDPSQMPNLPGFMAPSCFNQVPVGMGIQGQQGHHLHTAMNRQGVSGFEPFNGQLPPPITQGGFSAPRQFNPGQASNRGKKPYPRGGRANFSGRQGWRPTGT
ncbi:H/ACA ribonucleoprotein complex non-core subunit NAF1-like isoform X2 [Magnolia sinica]|uniref:H/ACA ribonucleoprotein complex non-core subunit NAF1-like isoform X2 n=1 Tax=Magnolia sinica TaxID=86752 RepID=UPI00265996BD|nr:H/ACA ribonucleoprotein complex non-core subunit NAF1-like isoform X2 [Magnolia sinica]